MSINRKKLVRHYTIVEVLVAMAIFLIMMTIMMRFFTSSQQVWNTSANRNMLYADARVAMNLMTREIQSMLYFNDDNDQPSSVYPFWYQWTDVDDNLTSTEMPQDLEDYFVDNGILPEKVIGANPKDAYLTVLNFISSTDLKPCDKGSDICEIRYRFVPVYYKDASPENESEIGGGKLQRSCVAEYNADENTTSSDLYNFAAWEYKGPAPSSPNDERVTRIWNDDAGDDDDDFQTVITGVYSLKFTCYHWNSSSLALLAAMDENGNDIEGNVIDGTHTLSSIFYNRSMGTPCPLAVRIDMKLMPPKDLKRLALNIYRSQNGTTSERVDAEKQIRTLKQKIRTFSKVIYLGKREDDY